MLAETLERFPPWLKPRALHFDEGEVAEVATSSLELYAQAVAQLEQPQVVWYIKRLKLWRRKCNNSQAYCSKATKIMDKLIKVRESRDQLIDILCYFDGLVRYPSQDHFLLDSISELIV